VSCHILGSRFIGSDSSAVRFMCHPNVQLKDPLSFFASTSHPTLSLLEESIHEACRESPISSSSSDSAALSLCSCSYHVQHPLQLSPVLSDSLRHPSITDLLREITPEACERMRKKRSRDRDDQDGQEDESEDERGALPWLMPLQREGRQRGDCPKEEEATRQIAEVMGFGSFCSSKRVREDS
jgi:hypothetical protein